MTLDWADIEARGARGIGISEGEALALTGLSDPEDLAALLRTAGAVRQAHKGNYVNTCGITNAKSGRCPEKCSFCSQSAHFETDAPAYAIKDADTIAAEARSAFDMGVREFSIVMSGRAVEREPELAVLEHAFQRIRAETGMQTCASLGLMRRDHLARLQSAGMQSMHHNLETARSFHAEIVATHSYDDEVDTIKAAKSLGMYVCSGGIFGMGETWAQRVELAMDLRELDVDSVPVNFLNARPGTPLQGRKELNPTDCLKIIALLRLVMPTKDVIVCGGRELNLEDEQRNMFHAGANGVMLGNYLTTAGQTVALDHALMAEQGMVIRPPPHQPLPRSVPPGVRGEGTDLGALADKPAALASPAK